MTTALFYADSINGLQWGRDHLIAEMRMNDLVLWGVLQLQWGRDHLIAEMPSPPPLPVCRIGFNGAAIT